MDIACPVCNQHFYDLDASFSVCMEHLDLYVTVCSFCGQACYSPEAGICPSCAANLALRLPSMEKMEKPSRVPTDPDPKRP